VEEAAGANSAADFAKRHGRVSRRKVEKRSIRPDPVQRAIPKREAAGVGLNPRTRELWEACTQHPERQVE
jgi:hypothetical protein